MPLFYLYYSLVGIDLGFHPTIGSISWLFSLEWVDSTLGMIQRWIYRSIVILLKTHMHPFIMLINSIFPKKKGAALPFLGLSLFTWWINVVVLRCTCWCRGRSDLEASFSMKNGCLDSINTMCGLMVKRRWTCSSL